MPDLHKNFAISTVATRPSPQSSGLSLVCTAGEGSKFPTGSFNVTAYPPGVTPTTANAEIVRCTVSTDTFTIARAQEGTSAKAIDVGWILDAGITVKTLTDIENPPVVTLVDGATPALDASLGWVFRLAAAGNRTIAVPTNPSQGQRILIQHFASGGARTLALNTGAGGFRFGSDIPALTATASGKTDYIGCLYNNTDTKWDVLAYVKGF